MDRLDEVIGLVLEQIKKDVADDRMAPLKEMLKSVNFGPLIAYLPELEKK
jgi:hypothetical protein|tara:strand:+ start:1711 stop:1860 length:150 start_codon:yes stop_codon:yes gene_type:complete